MKKTKKQYELEFKTYKERADYLSFINPAGTDIYQAIADFFGENNIPPLSVSLPKSLRKLKK